MLGEGWAHYEKSGILQKKVTHYKKVVPETRKRVPETTTRTTAIAVPLKLLCMDHFLLAGSSR